MSIGIMEETEMDVLENKFYTILFNKILNGDLDEFLEDACAQLFDDNEEIDDEDINDLIDAIKDEVDVVKAAWSISDTLSDFREKYSKIRYGQILNNCN